MIRINQLKLPFQHTERDFKAAICKVLHVKEESLYKFVIIKRSIDARKKNDIKYIYAVDCEVSEEEKILKLAKSPNIIQTTTIEFKYSITGENRSLHRPIVIGSGPAGLFCAYFLAKNGYQPIVLERGESVDQRMKTIEQFWAKGILNTESNVQFGEGGAGTFSDGKLNSMVKDTYGRVREVLRVFTEHGAPGDILYLNKPHIGTDKLREVVKHMREKIISLGGEFRFQTKLTGILVKDNAVSGIRVEHQAKEEVLPCDLLVLAIGHSARDTFSMLHKMGLTMESKAFAVGVRVEHEQELIGRSQYGRDYQKLPPADYKVTHQCKNGRGVYSFCMCPGGFVVNASSEENHLTVNGMSNYKRDERNANSALIVTVTPDDLRKETGDTSPLAGIFFQRKFEELAYRTGQGKIPVQLYGDLLRGKPSESIGKIVPNIKGNYQLGNLYECLPNYVIDSILEGMGAFDRMIPGFSMEETLLEGVEMRTSSPIRILRNKELQSNIFGIYPCGEGAGYAGGITSAAIDGIKVFEEIIKKYRP